MVSQRFADRMPSGQDIPFNITHRQAERFGRRLFALLGCLYPMVYISYVPGIGHWKLPGIGLTSDGHRSGQ
jgi:hypothetical protein